MKGTIIIIYLLLLKENPKNFSFRAIPQITISEGGGGVCMVGEIIILNVDGGFKKA